MRARRARSNKDPRGRVVGPARTIGLVAALLALSLIVGVGSASAVAVHKFAGSFGGAGTTPADPYPLSSPGAVAVDNSTGASKEDVYVTDPGNFRVEKFTPSGEFVLMFGKDVDETSGGNVCTAASGDVCKSGVQGTGGSGQFSAPAFIAVDSSGSTSAGDVYVADLGTETVYKFSSSGVFLEANDGSASPGGPFAEIHKFPGNQIDGIAVDHAGNLWVATSADGELREFGPGGASLAECENGANSLPSGLAITLTGNLLLANLDSVQAVEQEPNCHQVGTTNAQSPEATGFAVDPVSGGIYLNVEKLVEQFEPCGLGCNILEQFGGGLLVSPAGLAVDGSDATVYAADPGAGVVDRFAVGLEAETGEATEEEATTATVVGTVNPRGTSVVGCSFEYGTVAKEPTAAVPCEGPAVGSGTGDVEVKAKLEKLTPGVEYFYRVVASNANRLSATGSEHHFETKVEATVENPSVTDLTASSATLNAGIDPQGPAASYRFEYGTDQTYGTRVPIPDGQLAEGTTAVPVSEQITGLSPGTTYHWRVVTKDVNGTFESPDHTFRFDTESQTLPDGREYEMVTPVHKNGALIGVLLANRIVPDVSRDGTRVIAPSIQCFEGAKGCVASRHAEGEPYEFARTNDGWVTHALAAPATQFASSSLLSFSADTQNTLFAFPGSAGSADKFYDRTPEGSFQEIGPIGEGGTVINNVEQHDVTGDAGHVLYQTVGPVWASDDTHKEKPSLYEYSGFGNTEPHLVAVTGASGSHELISRCGAVIGGSAGEIFFYGALSEDGETAYFTAQPCSAAENAPAPAVPAYELFARYEHAHSELISTSSSECSSAACLGAKSGPVGDAAFLGAASDGSRVLFTDTQQLTNDASEDSHAGDSATSQLGCRGTAGGFSGCNLYLSECPARCAVPADRKLVDVSAGDETDVGPRVQGVVAISQDGSHVYFVAKGVLPAAANSEGNKPENGQLNLYAYERDPAASSGHRAFIGTLSGADIKEWEQGFDEANVTPDGRFLVFTSHRALTADDSRPEGPAQVYRYDDQTGALVRISIGAQGFNDNGNAGASDANASIAPARIFTAATSAPRRPDPTMSNDGAYVFFESPVSLTSHALNDAPTGNPGELAKNIYEYHDGEVSLISDGKDASERGGVEQAVHLLGSDATGANVFFATYDSLVKKDTDTQLDYYDAHICSAGEPCPPEAEPAIQCAEEGCHRVAGTPPSSQTPATETFTGPGNLPTYTNLLPPAPKPKPLTRAQKLTKALQACHKDRSKKRRATCEKKARSTYGPIKKAHKKRGRK
jgi:sugar lactone lactonase YvrE